MWCLYCFHQCISYIAICLTQPRAMPCLCEWVFREAESGLGKKSQSVENVRRCEILRKWRPCQNAILWTLLFTPHAQHVTATACSTSCLLYGEEQGRVRGSLGYCGIILGSGTLAPASILVLSGILIKTTAHTSETKGSILACSLSSCYIGF